MADTTYVDGATLLTADTMNDLNRLHYTILSDPADSAAVKTALGLVIGTNVQAYDADTTKNDIANTFTAQQSFTGTAATAPAIAGASDPNTGVFFPAADTVGIATGGTERMRIDDTGRVGIGVAPSIASAPLTVLGGPIQIGGGTTAQEAFRIGREASYANFTGINNDNNAYNGLKFYTSATASLALDTTGNVLATNANGGLGYGTGAGGTVTQATSRATAVTLNKPTGQITMFTAAGAATWSRFQVNNSLVGATDTIVVTVGDGSNTYLAIPEKVAAGSFFVSFISVSGTASDAPVINFSVIKGATT